MYMYNNNAPNMLVQAPMLGLTRHEMNTLYMHVSPSFMVIYRIVININNIQSNTTQLMGLLRSIPYIVSFNDMFRF
jgi:hypothetical protein